MTEHDNARTFNDVPKDRERAIRRRQTVRLVVFGVIAAALVAWALANVDDVEVDWLFATTTAPLVVVIALSAVLGVILGAILMPRRDG